MKRGLSLICLACAFIFSSLPAQDVGIGTDAPNAQSILDITSTDKGILIPRMTTLQRNGIAGLDGTDAGLLIYNTDTAAFNYWDGAQWVAFPAIVAGDADWYEALTSVPPDDIVDDIYHNGRVGIGGTTSPIYLLDIHATAVSNPAAYVTHTSVANDPVGLGMQIGSISTTGTHTGIELNFDVSGNNSMEAIRIRPTSFGSGDQIGLYNQIYNGGGTKTGVLNEMLSGAGTNVGTQNVMAGSNDNYGVWNTLTGGSVGTQRGVYNDLNTSAGTRVVGVENYLHNNTGGSDAIGVYNIVEHGSSDHFGTRNQVQGTGTGIRYGVYNEMLGSSTSAVFGTYSSLNTAGTGLRYGAYNAFQGAGSGDEYGVYNDIQSNNSTSDKYGMYNFFLQSNANAVYGLYNQFASSAADLQVGVYNDLTNPGGFPKYGVYNESLNTGGEIHTVYNHIDNTSTLDQSGVWTVFEGNASGDRRGIDNDIEGGSELFGVDNDVIGSTISTSYGIRNLLSGSGTGIKYGSYNLIDPFAGGEHYAVYGEALKIAANTFAGYFLGDVAIGTAVGNTYIFPASRGTADQVMQTDGSGNISWVDPSSIQSDDPDWFGEGTTFGPLLITDDIYHSGNVAIGKNLADYPLDVASTASRVVNLSLTGSAATPAGISLVESSSGTGDHFGLAFTHGGTHNEDIYGASISMNNTGTGAHTGFRSILNTGAGPKTGLENDLDGNGANTGVANTISGGGTGTHYAVENNLDGTTTGDKYGVYTSATGGNGSAYGVFNELVHQGTVIPGRSIYGVYSDISYRQPALGGFNDYATGVYNRMDVSEMWQSYGVFNDISGGEDIVSLYGTYNRMLVDSVGQNATGTYNFIEGVGNASLSGTRNVVRPPFGQQDGNPNAIYYGTNNSVSSTSNFRVEGTRNDIIHSGSGRAIATYNFIRNSLASTGEKYGTWNDFTVVGNGGSGDLYGFVNKFFGSNSDDHFGTHNYFANTGTGTKYGGFHGFGSLSQGVHYGQYVYDSSATNYDKYGYYVNLVAGGTGRKYGIFANTVDNSSTWAAYLVGDAYVSENLGVGIDSPADKLVVAGGRVEFTDNTDASGTIGTGVLEIANSLRIDENEIITNTGNILALQNDNNGDLTVDANTFYVDASLNRVGIGTNTPVADLEVSGGRAELTGTTDASGTAGSGVLEIANSLRIDGNEIITNTGSILYLQNDNNGDLRVDLSTLCVDASLNRVGIGTTTPGYQLELTTNSAGKPTSSFWTITSDERLKKEVRPYLDGLELIRSIDPVWFTYNGKAGMPEETGVGTIAQDFQKIAPYMIKDWVYTDPETADVTTYLGIDYGPLQFAMVNAIKEQQDTIEKKEERIASLESTVKDLVRRLEAVEANME